MITFTEPYSPANAGIVWFPRLNPQQPAHSSIIQQGKKNLSQLLTTSLVEEEEASTNLARLHFVKKLLLLGRIRISELCSRKQSPPMKTNPHNPSEPIPTWKGEEATTEQMRAEYIRRQTALDWNLEAEYALLNYTPLHRSKALSRDDLIHAWACLGDAIHRTCIPQSHVTSRELFTGNLELPNQQREPSIGGWAGPCFEQTVLQTLFCLQSDTAAVISFPGGHSFMEPYIPDTKLYLPPFLFHAFGQNAKKLIESLNKLSHWFTLEEVLTALPHPSAGQAPLLPMILTPDGFTPCMGAQFFGIANPVTPPCIFASDWILAHPEPIGCARIRLSVKSVSPT